MIEVFRIQNPPEESPAYFDYEAETIPVWGVSDFSEETNYPPWAPAARISPIVTPCLLNFFLHQFAKYCNTNLYNFNGGGK